MGGACGCLQPRGLRSENGAEIHGRARAYGDTYCHCYPYCYGNTDGNRHSNGYSHRYPNFSTHCSYLSVRVGKGVCGAELAETHTDANHRRAELGA